MSYCDSSARLPHRIGRRRHLREVSVVLDLVLGAEEGRLFVGPVERQRLAFAGDPPLGGIDAELR